MGESETMIEREMLAEMFDATRGKASWDIDGPCLWGYFFTDRDRTKLVAAGKALEARGYRFVDVLDSKGNDDEELLFLHVEKVEQHTVESLHQRNHELYRFAEEHGLESYDGMDVGSAEG